MAHDRNQEPLNPILRAELGGWRAEVIGMATSNGYLKSHLRYTAYGVAIRLNPVDIADDAGTPLGASSGVHGGNTEADYNSFFSSFFDKIPTAKLADIADDQGAIAPGGSNSGVTEADYNIFFGLYFDGWDNTDTYGLSTASTDNTIGYAGYEQDPILLTPSALSADPNQSSAAYYHVRHSVYGVVPLLPTNPNNPQIPGGLAPGVVACIDGCVKAWAGLTTFYCVACGTCAARVWAKCRGECYYHWLPE